ncbi:hypothetical protein [Streptomyces sp. NPDC097981]|uniref:hypothetical protein n=1 Tax=Streptomyces sp. NPDC097981 TaxID=3155428 RepID=UPI0033265EE6
MRSGREPQGANGGHVVSDTATEKSAPQQPDGVHRLVVTHVNGDAYDVDVRGHRVLVDQPAHEGGADTVRGRPATGPCPVSRNRLLAERTAALLVAALALNAAATLTVAVGVAVSPSLHRAVPITGVLAAGVMGFGFALCLTGPALAVSAWGRRRAQVIGATIAMGAVGFAVNFVALAWSRAEPLRFISPFHYYTPGDALALGGVLWPRLGVLAGVGVLGIVLAHVLLGRRDLAP